MTNPTVFWILQTGLWLAAALLWIIPTWLVLGRVGKLPALSLLALVPFVGVLVVLFVLAYGRWPRFENQAGA